MKSELYDIANSTLQNFMDEIQTFGFIPNGGRIYCEYMRLKLSHKHAHIMPKTWIGLNPRCSCAYVDFPSQL